MITGNVSGLEPRISVALLAPGKGRLQVEFVVDTGFSGYLTLPAAAIAALGFPYSYELSAKLADDSSADVDVHTATVNWDGQELEIDVLAMGTRPLLGTSLLAGFDVNIQFADGGQVVAERI